MPCYHQFPNLIYPKGNCTVKMNTEKIGKFSKGGRFQRSHLINYFFLIYLYYFQTIWSVKSQLFSSIQTFYMTLDIDKL